MRDARLDNLKGEMKSLSSMQAMIKYFTNPENKESFFTEYKPYMHPATHDTFSGAINKMPYLVMTEMLDTLMPTKINKNGTMTTEYPFGKEETEDFLRKNVYSFLTVCPKEFTIHCPQDVLQDMANGKFTSVEVRNMTVKEFEDGQNKENTPTVFDSFNKTSGPMVAKLIMNAQSTGEKVDVGQVVEAFLLAERYRNAHKEAQDSFFKDMVTVMDSMYSNPARNHMPNEVYYKHNLFKNIDKSTMDFIKSHIGELTKGLSPFIALSEQGKYSKEIVSFFKDLTKTYDGPMKDATAAKETADLENISSIMRGSSILQKFVEGTRDTVANDVLTNDTLSRPIENEAIDTRNHSTEEIEI